MRLVTYVLDGAPQPAIELPEAIVDLDAAGRAAGLEPPAGGWSSARQLLERGPQELPELAGAARELAAGNGDGVVPADVELGPPVHDPAKIICLGLNYVDHAEEAELEPPSIPMFFAKYANSLAGPSAPIVAPPRANQVDYEAELAVVIGRKCKDVEASDALSAVAGVMAMNDVSARDLQWTTSQWTAGKAIDTFAPCGPALVLLRRYVGDEGADLDVNALRVTARVNGEARQDASTSLMIFSVAEIIAFLSELMTLAPGDVIATGTPAGVGSMGSPARYLAAGDMVEVEIEGIGRLRNRVVAAS